MSKSFKPANYNSVSPYFIVKGAKDFISFLEKLFDAEVTRKYDKEDGSIMHAEVRIDDTIVMVADSTEEYSPTSFWMHVYVEDSYKIYKKAMELGCEGIEEPVAKEGEDPDVRGTFKDKYGNFWAVGTQK